MTEIHAFSRVNPGNVYLYSFDFSSALTKKNLNVPFPHKGAVHHAEDLQYLFPREELNADDIKMAKTMVQLWTSFAIRGVPSAKDVSFWPPADRKCIVGFSVTVNFNSICYCLRAFWTIPEDQHQE